MASTQQPEPTRDDSLAVRVCRSAVRLKTVVVYLPSAILFLFTWYKAQFTEPVASRVCYCDSLVHFNNVDPEFGFMQFNVSNPGPGDIEDAKLVAKVLATEASHIKHAAMYGGYSSEMTNGNITELIVSNSSDLKEPSPINDGERLGMEVYVSTDVNTLRSFDGDDPSIGVFLRRLGRSDVRVEAALPAADQSPYEIVMLAAVLMALLTMTGLMWCEYVKFKAEQDADKHIEKHRAKWVQKGMKQASKNISESEHLEVEVEEAASAIEQMKIE